MPARSADDVHIETYGGPRDDLRPLFESMPQVAGFFQKPFDPRLLREAVVRAAAPK